MQLMLVLEADLYTSDRTITGRKIPGVDHDGEYLWLTSEDSFAEYVKNPPDPGWKAVDHGKRKKL